MLLKKRPCLLLSSNGSVKDNAKRYVLFRNVHDKLDQCRRNTFWYFLLGNENGQQTSVIRN